MRRPSHHPQRRERLELKMTPLVDVIFLLLIFFVCTASFHAPEKILPTRLSLPGQVQSDVPPDPEMADLDKIVVEVLWRNIQGRWRAQWQINQRPYRRLAEVRRVLEGVRQIKSELPVILDVEPEVPIEDVIDVYDLCRRVGLARVQFAASPEGHTPIIDG